MRDLSTEVTKGLVLRDPFMIASSHWTAGENVFRRLASVRPSALTLKTTSHQKGGDGSESVGKRDKRNLLDYSGDVFAVYTDGPTTLELWDIPTTYEMTPIAKRLLPETILGLSVLQGENYQSVFDSLEMSDYGYVELNWKYAFRGVGPEHLQLIIDDVETFLSVFESLPRIVKLPREATTFVNRDDFQRVLSILRSAEAALIVANSKRLRVPPSRVSGNNRSELSTGVVIGEHLFLDTYNLIHTLDSLKSEGVPVPALIGSGGIVDIGGVVDIIAAGTNAVQLCTAMDLRQVQVIELLREQLWSLCKEAGSFRKFASEIRGSHNVWYKASTDAYDLDHQVDNITHTVLSDRGRMSTLIANVLQAECSNQTFIVLDKPNIQITNPYRFIITLGNVSSYVLGQHVVQQLNLEPVRMESTAEFTRRLGRTDFHYDFAILPQSVLNYLNKYRPEALGGKLPVEVGHVAQSFVELVGDITSSKLTEIEQVYHFSGVSARHTRGELLKTIHPEMIELSTIDLLPLFRFWNLHSAILVKPPLSQIYPLLGTKDLQEHWGVFWQHSEPLLLVASKELMSSPEGEEVARHVLYELERGRELILRNPNGNALVCVNGGFLAYFAKLLGNDKSTVI